ncbi:hypothetical protein L6R53_21980 [Myxococcota bacterium]|nr:hypothetical protein [Myxococcota bacterium]
MDRALLLLLATCLTSGETLAAGMTKLDGEPIYQCPRPPDDALIWVLPEESGSLSTWYDETDQRMEWRLYLFATSWIIDLNSGLGAPMIAYATDMESDFHVMTGGSFKHLPSEDQGESYTSRHNYYGDGNFFSGAIGVQWDGEVGSGEMYDDTYPTWFAPAGLCMSVLREDRVAGTFWFDPRNGTVFEDELPGLVFQVFQATGGPSSYEIEHPYAADPHSTHRRPQSLMGKSYDLASGALSSPVSDDTGP